MSTNSGKVPDISESKQRLHAKLGTLRDELDRYLAAEYGKDRLNIAKEEEYVEQFGQWRQSHRPFHWFVEFYGIIHNGGFDVIIGNPPYVEISDIAGQYSLRGLSLTQTGNLYSVCVERFIALLAQSGRMGVIVPISSISTPRMLPLMQLLNKQLVLYISNFAVRPGKLFVGVDMNLTILIGIKKLSAVAGASSSTCYSRWNEENRISLFKTLSYNTTTLISSSSTYPKLGSQLALAIESKLALHKTMIRLQSGLHVVSVYYHSGGRYFRKCIRKKLSNEYKELKIIQGAEDAVICLLSSSFYYWLWITHSDCYHVTKRDIETLPIPDSLLKDTRFSGLANALLADLEKHAQVRIRNRADGSQREEVNYYVGKSKPIIDEIDRVLAQHYGFTDEELDFIINYDIKYRMGRGESNDEE